MSLQFPSPQKMAFNIRKRNILQVIKNHANKCLDNMDFNFRIIKEEWHVKTLYINNLINSFIKKNKNKT